MPRVQRVEQCYIRLWRTSGWSVRCIAPMAMRSSWSTKAMAFGNSIGASTSSTARCRSYSGRCVDAGRYRERTHDNDSFKFGQTVDFSRRCRVAALSSREHPDTSDRPQTRTIRGCDLRAGRISGSVPEASQPEPIQPPMIRSR